MNDQSQTTRRKANRRVMAVLFIILDSKLRTIHDREDLI